MNKKNHIIAALSSPYGKSAVAVIRISGEGCKEIAERYLSRELKNGELRYNTFKASGFTEHLMAVYFEHPHSYTGEDTVELYPHGNTAICDGIIKTLTDDGARLAERGEFTKRAFLNGKLDLMKCEALADIIDAQTTEQLVYGNARFDGQFKSLETTEKQLNKALSTVEAILHYGDELEGEDIDSAIVDDVFSSIDVAAEKLEAEINAFDGGKIINDGFKIAVIGEPNVGKSTLLNALTDSDRAIVTDIAGTTRDIIDGEYVYNGRKFVIIDTAGIKDYTADEVEKIGIERAKTAAKTADAVLYVVTDDRSISRLPEIDGKSAVIINKCDEINDAGTDFKTAESDGMLKISAKFGKNVTALKQKLYEMCPKDHGALCNHRQFACAVKCLDSLKAAQAEREKSESLEIVAALLYDAYSAITALHGENADENVISSVFERFCVGK